MSVCEEFSKAEGYLPQADRGGVRPISSADRS
jgi:hypothetical protein